MASIHVLSCCGMKEITNIGMNFNLAAKNSGAEGVLKDILPTYYKYYGEYRQRDDANRTTYWYCSEEPHLYIPGAFFIFTEAHQQTQFTDKTLTATKRLCYGWRLARYIRKNNLGTLMCTKQRPNRNYIYPEGVPGARVGAFNGMYKEGSNEMHMITAYLWCPDHKNLQEWCRKNLPMPAKAKPGF